MIEKILRKRIWRLENDYYLCTPKVLKTNAEVAQLVEHHLAKVRVAGSSLVFRSDKNSRPLGLEFFVCARFIYRVYSCPGGGIGRRAGLKILYAAMRVRVQVPPGARVSADLSRSAFFIRQQSDNIYWFLMVINGSH